MTKQPVAVELFYDGTWNDITANDEVFTDTPITIVRGQGSESQAPRPCSIACRFNNATDNYRVSNPNSPLYGKVGRNTPIRVSVDGSVRGQAEVSSWETDQSRDFRQTPSRGKAWADVKAGGLLRRINQWSKTPDSPMRRWITARTDLVDYWPCYDNDSATKISSATNGNPARAETGFKLDATFGKKDSPLGSTAALQIGTESAIVGDFKTSVGGNWTVSFAFRLTKPPVAAGPGMPIFTIEMPNFWSAVVFVDDTSYNLVIEDPTSSPVDISLDYDQGDEPTQWVNMTVSMGQNAGTNNVEWSWYPQGGTTRAYIDSFSGGALPAQRWRVNANNNISDAEFSEIFLINTFGYTVDSSLERAFDAYDGELAAVRFGRLMDEALGPGYYYVSNNYAESIAMGPQRPDTLPNLIMECVSTEDALLFDVIDTVRLFFICRFDRLNQTPGLNLVPADFPALPREVTDDLGVANIVTASQRDGGEFTARDDTTVLGTQTPPDGVGEYEKTVDVNVETDTEILLLPHIANWWLRRGTVNLPRFPQVTLDLVASPHLVDDVESLEIGSIITITGYRENVIRLQILGWTEVIGNNSRRITFNCAPDQQFDVAIQDDASKRQDSATSTLSASYNASATSMVVGFTVLSDQWSQVNTPYDWVVAGERITVTSMGAVTGSGPWTQTATVARSANEIVKFQTSGEPVRMAPDQQARQAL